jgi:rhodanese-related sulfurtransferase
VQTQIRSAKAAAVLTETGFRHVTVLRGGTVECKWQQTGKHR